MVGTLLPSIEETSYAKSLTCFTIDPLQKPPELYNLIENFCLGTRRLELFGNPRNARPGWLTIGEDEMKQKVQEPVDEPSESSEQAANTFVPTELYDKETFDSYFLSELRRNGSNLVPTSVEVDSLRPRSPGGANATPPSFVPGMKSNPQGIGRHTNRAATPSASQALEYEKLQAQFQEQFVRQQQQQQLMEFERQRQEEMMQQQALMMQQMAMMGMPPTMSGMPMGMNGFAPGYQQNQMMIPNGQLQWPMQMGMNGGMPIQGQYQNFNNGQQQYQPTDLAQQGQFNPGMNGMFPNYNAGF